MDTYREVTDLFNGILRDMRKDRINAMYEKVKSDPKANKDTVVFDAGKMKYTYYERKIRGETVRWCYTRYPNAAGYYLSFIEVVCKLNGARTKFIGHKTKRLAIEDCRLRWHDAAKPKTEWRFTIPTYKQIYAKSH